MLAVLAMAVVLAACTGTTVISEGTRGSEPASTPEAAERASAPDDDEDTDDQQAVDAPGDVGLIGQDQIVGLTVDCAAGSDLACDILFQASTLDSPEEELARTCGGRRSAADDFCTEAIERDESGIWFDDASPGLAAVEDACRDGDLTACDFLYFRSEIGSVHEELGTTCGGRVDVAIPDCRTALGGD